MPIVNGRYLQPWRVPQEGAESKPPVKPEAEDETMQSVTKRRVQARKVAGGRPGRAQAKAAQRFDAQNRAAAERSGDIEDLSDLGLDEGRTDVASPDE